MVGFPLSFFLYVFLRKGICPFFFFETSKNEMAWKHIGTLEWKLKRNVAPVPSEMVRSLAQEEGVIHIILTCSASPLFLTIPSRVLFLPVSNRTCWKKNLLHGKPARFRSGKSVVNPLSDRSSWQLNPIFPIILLSIIVRKEGPAPSCSGIVALSFSTLCLRIS